MLYIYVYELVFNKYYVGKTTDIEKIDQQLPENDWIKLYKPVRLLETYPDCDVFDLDKYTLKYMKEKGIDNVRGGSFSSVELSEGQKQIINEMINGSEDGEEIGPIEIQIKEYLDDFDKVLLDKPEYLVESIEEFDNIFGKIIELKQLIERTNFVSMDDLPEIKKQDKEFKEFRYLENKRNSGLNEKDTKRFSELNNQFYTLQNTYDKQNIFWKREIDNCVSRTGVVPVKNYYEKNLSMLTLEIIQFNLSKKLELKNIYEKYHSEEFVSRVLIELRKKSIEKLKSYL